MQEVEVCWLEKTIADVTFAHGSMDRSSKTTGEGPRRMKRMLHQMVSTSPNSLHWLGQFADASNPWPKAKEKVPKE